MTILSVFWGGDSNHDYKAPGPNDLRSPCPFLNTLANHVRISPTLSSSSQSNDVCPSSSALSGLHVSTTPRVSRMFANLYAFFLELSLITAIETVNTSLGGPPHPPFTKYTIFRGLLRDCCHSPVYSRALYFIGIRSGSIWGY